MSVPQNTTPREETSSKTLALLTCSMAADADLFGLLAESVDRHVPEDIPHNVVVPGRDIIRFKRYETNRRRIIAQEEILPVKIWKLPSSLKYLEFVRSGFRRPLYLTQDRQLIRGWMIQQFLKIEMTRTATQDAVMHVDSDVAFFRNLDSGDAFSDGKVRYFRTEGRTKNPLHKTWVESSCQFLGIPVPPDHWGHYIENCVLWSTLTTKNMAKRMEDVNGAPLHEVIFNERTMSEYYVYGLFADTFPDVCDLQSEGVSFCNSFWPSDSKDTVDFTGLNEQLQPKHRAIAIQSTHEISLSERKAVYDRASAEFD